MTADDQGSLPAPEDPGLVPRIVETVALAFADDPTWSPIVESNTADPTASRRYWELFVRSAQRYPWTSAVDGAEAVAVWFPPGAEELTPSEIEEFPAFATELFGPRRTEELLRIIDRFDESRPPGEYFYLSLLATRPASRGRGLGLGLLQADLHRLDALGQPSYLESSNPANDARYARLGYRPHGRILLPSGLELTTMWRDPSSSAMGDRQERPAA